MSKKFNHLSLIEQVISRMGSNSFSLKGWSVGIMVAVYAFAGNSAAKAVIVTLIPLITFWIIDSYYLLLERKYRKLYDTIRLKSEDEINYSMNTDNLELEMKDIKSYEFARVLFSKSEFPFYFVCILTTLIIYFVPF